MLRFVLITAALMGSLACFLLGGVAWRRRPAPGAGFVAGTLFSAALYSFGYGLELSGNSLEMILTWLRLEYLGIVCLPVFWLAMTLTYTHHQEWLSWPRFLLLWIIPVVVLSAFYSNSFHQLYYTNISLETGGPFPVIQFDHGPIYLVMISYIFLALAASCFFLFQYLLLPHALYRKQTGVLLLSNLLMILVLILYFAGLQPIPNLDIVVYAVILSGLIIGFGLLRYHLVELAPVAREMLFDRLGDGVLVLDGSNRLVDYNPAGRRLLNLPQNSIGLPMAAFIPAGLQVEFGDLRTGPPVREFCTEGSTPRYYEINLSPISGLRGEKGGLLVVLHEITLLKQMQIALKEVNAELDERVQRRTEEYLQTIERLETEVQERQAAEKKLREVQDSLVEQVSIQSRRLYSLYDVLIHSESNGAGEVLHHSLDRIQQMMNADAACIHQYRDGLICRLGSVGLPDEVLGALDVLPGDWLLSGKPFMTTHLAEEERLPVEMRISAFCGYLAAPIRLQENLTGVLQVFWREPHPVQIEDISYFTIIAEQIGIILENERLRQKLEEKAAQLERRRLARDLHDSVTQSLHSLLLNAGVLRNRLEQGRVEKAMDMLARLEQSAHQALKEMRLLLFELRLAPLEQFNLIEALQNRLEAVELRAAIDARLQVEGPNSWPAKWETELYCIAMEALNNSLKHARASQVRVELYGGEGGFEMCIQDNGQGFPPGTLKNTGIGLQSMQERAGRLGGQLEIDSAEGQGTRIFLRIPLPCSENTGEALHD